MAGIPQNLLMLHAGEEELFGRTTQLVSACPDLADHLDITERAMDVMDMLRQHYHGDDDQRAISHLAMRAFNHLASAWKLTSTGYYQAAGLLLRDLVETTYLVSAFHEDRSLVSRWRTADRRTRLREFSPFAVRKILEDAAGLGKSRREQIYNKFSSLAGHPTPDGFAMLRPNGMDAQIGPFSDVTALRALLEEMGMLAIQAGFTFGIYLEHGSTPPTDIAHRFVTGAMDYSGKYLGKHYSDADRAEVEELYGRLASYDD
ncbi:MULTISPECIES: hypothetical protein [Xanthomonas]|uniref:hypothetical protein n=1 Tax=Xanthomonas TaxID=338 RepID=UPI0007ECF15E|nr:MULTISPECIES: hypothetical protein [Xanthomonas]ASW46210.1 hypothetical protein XJ27_09775 [Xanthomonas hortorum]MCE4305498.1 hypothetical protein [Xanthomonas hortorum pv. vitians]MCE4311520.1 hypothetical protein [Xanthomonas hortorum pv. vitians]MCE4336545.1 hypothetical protein [Xanthomonas hortorum pv. vitians]MCE4344071.1 hypothetical protein [Xanthomonas hortorum pv. vitians]